MAQLHLSARFRRRWWYSLARTAILVAVFTRIVRDIDSAVRWLINNGTVIELRWSNAEPTAEG